MVSAIAHLEYNYQNDTVLHKRDQYARPRTDFGYVKSRLLAIPSVPAPRQSKYAIATLFRYSQPHHASQIENWLVAVQNSIWFSSVDILLFHESCFCEAHLSGLVPMPLKFINISHFFSPKKYPDNALCPENDLSRKFNFGYKAMCHFWFIDIWSYTTEYDFVLRVDSDCFLSRMNSLSSVHLWDHWLASDAFMSPGQADDEDAVVVGLRAFVRDFARNRSLPVKRHLNPYTNVMGFKPTWWQRIKDFQNAVDKTNCIFLNRWGDLPLYGEVLFLNNISIKPLCGFSYYHKSHDIKIEGESCS
eukprot:g77139.t1